MSAIFVMDEHTYVHGVWSFGGPGFDCLGMLFKQKGEPWMAKWRFRQHADSSAEGLNDEKSVYMSQGRDDSNEERDALWDMQIIAAQDTADKLNKLSGLDIVVETILVEGGAMETMKAIEQFKKMSVAKSYSSDVPPTGTFAGPAGEA